MRLAQLRVLHFKYSIAQFQFRSNTSGEALSWESTKPNKHEYRVTTREDVRISDSETKGSELRIIGKRDTKT
jgi:hypothetical protein